MQHLLPLLPWLLTVPIAWWLTTPGVTCSPPSLVGPTVVVAGALLLWGSRRDEPDRTDNLALLSGLGLFSLLPVMRRLLQPGLPYGHDLTAHAWATWATARGIAAGDLLPRWADVLGVGMPVGQFYPPVTYVSGGALVAAGLTVTQAFAVLSWLSGALSAAVTWWVCRDLRLSRLASGVAAVAIMVAPYRLLNINYRFALGELFGLPLLLLLWHLVATTVHDPERRRPAAIAVVSALLLLTHSLSALMAAWGFLPAAVLLLVHRRDRETAIGWATVLGAGALGVLLASFHVMPMALEADAADIKSVLPAIPRFYNDHGLRVLQAFERPAWEGVLLSNPIGKAGPEMPIALGLMFVAPLPWLVRGARPELQAMALMTVWCWFASLAGPALILGELPPMRVLQFPWRFIGPASMAAVVVIAGWLHGRARPVHGAVVLLLVVWDGYRGLGANAWIAWPEDSIANRHQISRAVPTCEGKGTGWNGIPWTPEPEWVPADDGPLTTGKPWAGWPTGDVPYRVAGMVLPPNDLHTNVYMVHRAVPEFFTPKTVPRFRNPLHERDSIAHRDAVHSIRASGVEAQQRPVWPWVRLHAGAKSWGLAATVERPDPGTIVLTLPEGVRSGEVEVIEQDFPGWEVRVDDGAWAPVQSERGTLTVPIDAGAARVEFTYTANTLPRRLGMMGTLLGLLGLLGLRRFTASRR